MYETLTLAIPARMPPAAERGEAGLVSVIIATHDRPEQLARLLMSIDQQTYRHIETIIETKEIGHSAAYNEGFLKSRGEFVIFPDDDMELDPTMIMKLVDALTKHPSKAYAYCGFRQIDGDREFIIGLTEFDAQHLVLAGNYINAASLIRRRKFMDVGMFDPALRRLVDWDLWLSFLERGEEGILVPEVLFKHLYVGGPRISDDGNPRSLPYEIARKVVDERHSELVKSMRFKFSNRLRDPLGRLLWVYSIRPDLQRAFPEVERGDYSRLLDWAKECILSRKDNAHQLLQAHVDWYENNPLIRIQNEQQALKERLGALDGERSRLNAELNQSRAQLSRVREQLEAVKNDLQTEKALSTEQLEKLSADLASRNSRIESLQTEKAGLRSELENIQSSFSYRVIRSFASKIDRVCPDGTKRGELRKRTVLRLRTKSR